MGVYTNFKNPKKYHKSIITVIHMCDFKKKCLTENCLMVRLCFWICNIKYIFEGSHTKWVNDDNLKF